MANTHTHTHTHTHTQTHKHNFDAQENRHRSNICTHAQRRYNDRHTNTQLSIVVRTLIDIMHSLDPYQNLNNHN